MGLWHQYRARLARWRIQRFVNQELAKLSPEARAVLRKIHDDELDRHLGIRNE